MSQVLTGGSTVRVLRGGTDHVAQVQAPVDGTNLGLRTLDVGAYVARDECGGEVPFVVDGPNELVVLPVDGAGKGAGVTVTGPGGRIVDVVAPAPPSLEDQQVEPVQAPVTPVSLDEVENVDVRPAPVESAPAKKAPRKPRPSELKKKAAKKRRILRRKK